MVMNGYLTAWQHTLFCGDYFQDRPKEHRLRSGTWRFAQLRALARRTGTRRGGPTGQARGRREQPNEGARESDSGQQTRDGHP